MQKPMCETYNILWEADEAGSTSAKVPKRSSPTNKDISALLVTTLVFSFSFIGAQSLGGQVALPWWVHMQLLELCEGPLNNNCLYKRGGEGESFTKLDSFFLKNWRFGQCLFAQWAFGRSSSTTFNQWNSAKRVFEQIGNKTTDIMLERQGAFYWETTSSFHIHKIPVLLTDGYVC